MGEPVWCRRYAYTIAPFRLRYGIAPYCTDCNGTNSEFPVVYQWPSACEGCGRTVYRRLDRRYYRRTFCCKQCERQVRAAEARRYRAEVRGATRICQACGETFEPTRSDAKFCTIACKQKAYRRRVTDTNCMSAMTIESRNAEKDAA
jgi:hypothetical protein